MKGWLYLYALIGLMSCRHQNDMTVGPSDWLYKRWHILQTRHVNDPGWTMYDTDAYYDTEYRPDNTIIYRKNGVIVATPCCSGSQFERNESNIQYAEFLPCPTVLCLSITQATITILETDLLELQVGDRITQYTPAQ